MKTAFLCVCALAGVFAGCKTTSQAKPPWDGYITGVRPNSVWLTRTDHTVVRMDGPRVFGDRVVGAVAGDYTEIPLADVTQMTALHRDKGKTVAPRGWWCRGRGRSGHTFQGGNEHAGPRVQSEHRRMLSAA